LASTARSDLDWDALLREGSSSNNNNNQYHRRPRRLAIALGGKNPYDEHATLLASSTAAAVAEEEETAVYDGMEEEDDEFESSASDSSSATTTTGPGTTTNNNEIEDDADDPYANALNAQKNKMQQFQQRQQAATPTGWSNKLKEMELSDVILTVAVPAIVLFAAGKWGYQKIAVRVADKTNTLLDSFAREMIFHDADMAEMKLCVEDYSKRLLYLGPLRNNKMLKTYLEAFAKRKTVSPQAIASMSYVFSLFALSEVQAAQLLVSLCQEMGTDKISSAGKLLFLASRILKSPEGLQGLEPIKKLIMSTYRDVTVAETMVDTSQQAMAEAAYRTTVQSAGKYQTSLTPGWEVLGLDRSKAQEIYNEEAKEGFVSMREAMYGGQTTKYDKKGNVIEKDGNVKKSEETVKDAGDDGDSYDDDDDSSDAISNVYECSDCGYTLFVAKGREAKFFGQNFKCPECGAAKDKFQARDDMDD